MEQQLAHFMSEIIALEEQVGSLQQRIPNGGVVPLQEVNPTVSPVEHSVESIGWTDRPHCHSGVSAPLRQQPLRTLTGGTAEWQCGGVLLARTHLTTAAAVRVNPLP